MSLSIFRIGTRKSELAITQAEEVKKNLNIKFPDTKIEIVPIHTTGDIRRDNLDLNVQDKKQWIIELEQLLIENKIDLAVHCAKDVPLFLEEGTKVSSILKREQAEDVLILSDTNNNLNSKTSNIHLPFLKEGAKVGTSSNRRKSELLRLRPDLEVVACRGNVPTRIDKLSKENLDAIVIAIAGVNRLKITSPSSILFSIDQMIPSSGQGTLAAQFRINDNFTNSLVSSIQDTDTQHEFEAERACIDIIGADCHSSIGVKAKVSENTIGIISRILSKDGKEFIQDEISGDKTDSQTLGRSLGQQLIYKGALRLI